MQGLHMADRTGWSLSFPCVWGQLSSAAPSSQGCRWAGLYPGAAPTPASSLPGGRAEKPALGARRAAQGPLPRWLHSPKLTLWGRPSSGGPRDTALWVYKYPALAWTR